MLRLDPGEGQIATARRSRRSGRIWKLLILYGWWPIQAVLWLEWGGSPSAQFQTHALPTHC